MDLLVWLDALVMTLGLLAMSPRLWCALSRRIACRSALGRGRQIVLSLLFYVGLSTVAAAAIDVAIDKWNQAHHDTTENSGARIGMLAPDFALPALDEDHTVRLSDLYGHRPIVLIFGNFY